MADFQMADYKNHSLPATGCGDNHDVYDEHIRKALNAVYDRGFEAGVRAMKNKIADMTVQLTPMDRNEWDSKS